MVGYVTLLFFVRSLTNRNTGHSNEQMLTGIFLCNGGVVLLNSERYRDLIGAADCIVRMKETAFAVQDNISQMRNSCDIHALKRNVAAKTKKAQSGSIGKGIEREQSRIFCQSKGIDALVLSFFSSLDEMKKSLYTSAAQIKLLADVPEQVTR